MSDDKPNRLEHNWKKYATSLLLVCLGIFHAIKIIHFTKKILEYYLIIVNISRNKKPGTDYMITFISLSRSTVG